MSKVGRRAALWPFVLVAVAIVGSSLTRSHASPTKPKAAGWVARRFPPSFFGVNAWALFSAPSSAWGSHLSEMEQHDIEFVRSDAAWAIAEPEAPAPTHRYRWWQFDAIVAALAVHQLSWQPIIDYSAPWASAQPGSVFAPPVNSNDYAAYAAALAARYGTDGVFWRAHPQLPYHPVERWEIWNEENDSQFWRPSPDPRRYVDLYLAARNAIHSADPRTRVLVGGLGDGGNGTYATNFIAAMYQHRHDARGLIDAIAYHPYPLDNGLTAASSMQQIRMLRRYLDTIGAHSVPIDITEVGWTSQGPGSVSDATRARQLIELLDDLARSNEGVEEFIPYAWVTPKQDQDGFGMWRWDGAPTLEGIAYVQAVKDLSTSSPRASRRDQARG